MATGTSDPDWLMVMGDVRLGTLWLESVDQPWYICRFEAFADFETVRPLFEASLAAMEAGDLDGPSIFSTNWPPTACG